MGWHYIYFYGTEDGAEVKVGRTKQNPLHRREQHEHDGGRNQPMRTLAVVLGQVSDENVVKRHFESHKSRPRSKEWFSGGEEMRSYLRWLRSQSFVATNDAELDRLVPVDSSQWLPGAERQKSYTQLTIADGDDAWADLTVDRVMEGDYYTHPDLIDAARSAMGSIDLDPSSCREANTVVRATKFYSFRENGLMQEWAGNVWVNPPYGNWNEWVPKLLSEWASGRVDQMCVIATSRVSTAQSFHPLVRSANAVFIACGRFRFWGPNAKEPDEGHLIFYFGNRCDAFSDAYSLLGTVFAQRLA